MTWLQSKVSRLKLVAKSGQQADSVVGLSYAQLRAEFLKRFKFDIPLNQDKQWRDYHGEQQAQHKQFTQKIVTLEERLNTIVYRLFDLSPDEIQLIVDSTKYQYGEV